MTPGTSAGERTRTAGRATQLAVASCVAVAVVVVAVFAGGGGEGPHGAIGLPTTGTFTTYALPIARVVADLSAAVAVGCLVLAVFLLPRDGARVERVPVRAAVAAAAVWWLAAWATVPLTLSELYAHPVYEVITLRHLFDIAPKLPFVAAWWASGAAAACVVVVGGLGRSRRAAGWALVAALVGLGAVAASGHSATGSTPELAADSLLLHVVAAAVWAGGLVGVWGYVRWRGLGPDTLVALERFSHLALVCFLVIVATGFANLASRVSIDRWLDTDYGQLALGKLTALVALGMFGVAQRRRGVTAARMGSARALLVLGAGELVVLAGTIGLAVALSRTAPPVGEPLARDVIDGLGWTLPSAPSPGVLLAWWRPDLVTTAVAVAAVVGYLLLVGRACGWAWWRTAAWVTGWVVVVLATAGGVGRYAPAVFSVHVLQYVLLGVVAPALLVLAVPTTLWQAVAGTTAVRLDAHPAIALVLFLLVGGLVASGAASPLLAVALGRHLLEMTFLVVGWLLFASLAEVRADAARWAVAAAASVTHLLLGVALALRGAPAASTWFADIRPRWSIDATVDQTVSAPALWAVAQLPLLAVVVGTVVMRKEPQ